MAIAAVSLLLIALIGASAFFSSAETALLSVSPIRLRHLLKKKVPKAHSVAQLKKDMPASLTAILIVNNFVNSFASSLAAALAVSLLGDRGSAVAAAGMTLLIIVFGEVLPKTVAALKSFETAAGGADFLCTLRTVLSPLIKLFLKAAAAFTSLLARIWPPENAQITEGELKTLFDVGDLEGILESGEKEMLHRIFEFSDLRVRAIVRARALVKKVHVDASYEEALQAAADSGYSRLPVCGDSFDDVRGFVHFKDILFYSGSKQSFSLSNVMHRVLFVPDAQSALSLLHLFKTEKQNFAVVVDEHGSNCGIVTMDDMLKAVFGRITDEYNSSGKSAEERISIVSPCEFIIPGDMLLTDINAVFGLNLESQEYETVGGFLLEAFGYLPEAAEHIRLANVLFTVEEQSRRRIQRIRMQYAKEAPKERNEEPGFPSSSGKKGAVTEPRR